MNGSKPASENLAKLAMSLGCSFEWLATGRGSKHTNGKSQTPHEDTAVVMHSFDRDDAEEHVLSVFRKLVRIPVELTINSSKRCPLRWC